MCGDLNCPGIDSKHIHDDLSSLLESFDLTQHVKSPTRDHHICDIFASEVPATVSNLTVDDAGLISDHRLSLRSSSLTSPNYTTSNIIFVQRHQKHKSVNL